jgi:hypothetical protein
MFSFNLHLNTQEILSLLDCLNVDEQGRYSMEDLFNLIINY